MEYEVKAFNSENRYLHSSPDEYTLTEISEFITNKQGITSCFRTTAGLEEKLQFPRIITMQELSPEQISAVLLKFNKLYNHSSKQYYSLELIPYHQPFFD